MATRGREGANMLSPLFRYREIAARVAVALCLALTLGGCAATSAIEVQQRPTRTASMRTALVVVTTSVERSEQTAREIEGAIVEHLRRRNTFERVYSSFSRQGRPVDVTLEANVTRFQGVSDVARNYAGAFAGQAVIVADLVLKSSTGETLAAATVEGKSSAGSAFAGTTQQAIQLVAERAALFVAGQ